MILFVLAVWLAAAVLVALHLVIWLMLEERRHRREMQRAADWFASGGLDVPLPPKERVR